MRNKYKNGDLDDYLDEEERLRHIRNRISIAVCVLVVIVVVIIARHLTSHRCMTEFDKDKRVFVEHCYDVVNNDDR